MTDELQTTWKEGITVEMSCYPYTSLEGMRQATTTSVRVADAPADLDISF
jgi:hypothetical protein